jgi:hypothetical protein
MLARSAPLLRTVSHDREEILPGAAPTMEKKGGDDKQAGHRFTFSIATCGRHTEIGTYSFVSFVVVQGCFIVEVEYVSLIMAC